MFQGPWRDLQAIEERGAVPMAAFCVVMILRQEVAIEPDDFGAL